VRLVLVVLTLPFAMQWAQSHWGLQVDARLLPGPVVAHWPGLFWLALSTGVVLGHGGFQADQSLVHGGFAGLDGLDAVGGALVGRTHGIVECRAVGHWGEPGCALSA
jgi:hypothetical protein